MHMSSLGHQRMAIAVLDALGVEHDLAMPELARQPALTAKERRAANVDWARAHAAPWVKRRLTGVSSGDSLSPRRPTLAPVEVRPYDAAP